MSRRARCAGNVLIIIMAIASVPSFARHTVLDSILSSLPSPFRAVPMNPEKYGLQILYTQVNRDRLNHPHFKHLSFHVDRKRYFYPASLVKLPVAALAIEKLNRLNVPGLGLQTRMQADSTAWCMDLKDAETAAKRDSLTIESCIKRMFLVSDNDGYNRLWEFLTCDYANKRLIDCGYERTRLLHSLASCNSASDRKGNPVRFLTPENKIVYEQPFEISRFTAVNPLAPVTMGRARIENGRVVPRPFVADFLNYAPLEEVHRFLIGIMFPATVKKARSLVLSSGDYRFLRAWLCMLPRESGIPRYASPVDYPDNFKKYLLFGDGSVQCVPELREFNVVGRAYGFMSDVAYFADFMAGVEFFLSAVIFANEEGIINSNHYQYDTVALPFFSALGAAVYEYEKARPRLHRPDLREFEPVAGGIPSVR
jgi:hypothetical protein